MILTSGRSKPRRFSSTPGRPSIPARRRITSVPPEILEPVRRQGRIDRGARDRPMAEPSLDRPGVVALVGERVAAGVAEHVWMRLQFEARGDGSAFDHPGKAGGREWRAALADEDEGRTRPTCSCAGRQGDCATAAQSRSGRLARRQPQGRSRLDRWRWSWLVCPFSTRQIVVPP
jgi:hypothetical protein